ncbi:MAG TPA: PQQ-binding-like beta-propeller repeat protein, partial [Vicinamibacterales bacterium]|nr:PQQ-binding-like beta-propeller repeat protein [Vicinamibacterales bacterium]
MRVTIISAVLLTAALQAQLSPSEALLDAARTGDVAAVSRLVDAGAGVNSANKYGVSALGFAAERGHFAIVRLLVERGADVNAVDSFYGSRPVDFALRGGHLDIAVYLLEHKALGAVSVLNTAIRRRDANAVRIALATKQADAAALASASTVAAQAGDAAIAAMVKAAADATPATAPKVVSLSGARLRSYTGNYQNAATGAIVKLGFEGERFVLSADGQPPLTLKAIDDRRFIADESPELNVVLSGRGGIIERLAIVRGSSSVRYEREGFGDATSAAPDPRVGVTGNVSTKREDSEAPRAAAINWPAFRGANAAGVGDGQGVVGEWNITTGKNVKWKVAIPGLGTSSPIVWGNRVYLVSAASDEDKTFRTGLTGDIRPIDALPVHTFRVHALDLATGKTVWQRDAFTGAPITKRHFKSSQANATPATNGKFIVALFGSIGQMFCYDINGALVWKKDIGALDSGWFLDPSYQWGHSSSPIIYKSSVIVQADQSRGSFIAAFDLATGKELWRTARPDEVSTWATPTIMSGPKGDELITNGTKVRGYDPATGALLWTLAPNSEIAIGTPVVHRNLAIITAGYPPVRPVYAVRAGARGDISLPAGKSASDAVAWSHDRDGTYISSPIVYRDQLYT